MSIIMKTGKRCLVDSKESVRYLQMVVDQWNIISVYDYSPMNFPVDPEGATKYF